MKKSNIEVIIHQLARENANLYPDSYEFDPQGEFTAEAAENVEGLAMGYWENRTEQEQARDFNAGVTPADYKTWCRVAVHSVMYEAYFADED